MAKRALALTLALDALRQELARGPRGDKGDRGERGEPGKNGRDGKDGRSIKGDKGDKGDKGEPGKNGRDGKDGHSIKGDKGDKGDRGDTGVSLAPTQDQIYAALLVYFKKNPVKDGESFDDVELVRMDDGINYKLRFHHTTRGWVDAGTVRVPRPFAKGIPVLGGGSGAAEALDGSDDATRVDITYVSAVDSRPARVVRDTKEVRYDWGTGAAGTYQYKGVAVAGADTSAAVWTIWRITLDALTRPARRDRLAGAWDDRVSLGWPS